MNTNMPIINLYPLNFNQLNNNQINQFNMTQLYNMENPFNNSSEKINRAYDQSDNDRITNYSGSTNNSIQQQIFQSKIFSKFNSINIALNTQNQMIIRIQQQINDLSTQQEMAKNQLAQMSQQQNNILLKLKNLQFMIKEIQIPQQRIITNYPVFFQYKQSNYKVEVNENDTIFQIIKNFRKQINDYTNKKFNFKGIELNPNLSCKQAGLINNSVISVYDS
jgi:hypothetical protein